MIKSTGIKVGLSFKGLRLGLGRFQDFVEPIFEIELIFSTHAFDPIRRRTSPRISGCVMGIQPLISQYILTTSVKAGS